MENSKLVQALEQIATGEIVGNGKDYKTTVQIMRGIATEALQEVYEGKKEDEHNVAKCSNCKKGESGFYFCSGNC